MSINLKTEINDHVGGQTEVYYAASKNNLINKIHVLLSLFFQYVLTLGSAADDPKFKKRWSTVFDKEINHQIIKITRIASNYETPLKVNQETLEKTQSELDSRGIPLNCLNPPHQEKLNDFDYNALEQYLSHVKTFKPEQYEDLKSFFEKDVDKITVKELEEHLARCAAYLDTELKNNYQVGFVNKKSLKWIAELALPYLSRQPEQYFEPSTDVGGAQSKLSTNSRKFVIFDDASYSGHQVKSIISSIQKEMISENSSGKIYFVIPFVSSVAEQYLVDELLRGFKAAGSIAHQGSKKLKVHLITSERKVKMMTDLDPRYEKIGLTFTEWKIPDTTSLSQNVSSGYTKDENGKTVIYKLLTDYQPCYKASPAA